MNMHKGNVADFYPLSPMQQGMLFHTIYTSEADVYFEQVHCLLKGDLDLAAFQRSWELVIERHTILRTGFLWERLEQPIQVVYRQVNVDLVYQDWREHSKDEQAQRLQTFLEEDKKRGFQLAQAPLLRLAVLQLAEDTSTFVFSYHHLILDGASLSLVISEALACYEAKLNGHELKMEPAPQYRDYILWLKQQNEALADAFWLSILKGFFSPTPLPLARSLTPAKQLALPLAESYTLSAQLTQRLVGFVRQHQLTLNTLLQGAWALLLSRYSGERDIVFGSTLSARPAELEHNERMSGLFINTLPVRVNVDLHSDLLTWLKQLQHLHIEMRQYDYSALARIQENSEIPRGAMLFESLVVFENYSSATLADFGKSLKFVEIKASETTNYPLTLVVVPGTSLELKFIYDCRYYTAPAVDQLFEHMQLLLEEMITTPQRLLGEIPLLTAAESQKLLVGWNKKQSALASEQSVVDLVEAQAALRPDALAVVTTNARLTYGELNVHANRLAHNLLLRGIGPEQRVTLYIERGADLLIGMLAILKTGAAYIPLDPAYPHARVAFMITDSQAPVVLTSRTLHGNIENIQAHVLYLDEEIVDDIACAESNPVRRLEPENLAYVIYTSGSTGQPKGVEITHRGLMNLVQWHQQAYAVTENDRATQLAGISFDAAVWEIWPYLTAGATLYLPDEEVRLDAALLYQWLITHEITLSFLPTPLAETVLALPWPQKGTLRALLTGGDRLHRPAHVADHFALVNHYGPTEYSVVVTAGRVTAEDELASMPHIGQPIAHTSVYVLDEEMRPLPIGAPGLLYVGGAGLARGYLHRPDLTAEHFVPDPFSAEKGARLYNTGDLAYYRADGNIHFSGRKDQQVKVRGFRIELEEIEALLRTYPTIQNAVVAVRENVARHTILIAYLIADSAMQGFPTSGELRNFLAKTLPEYMLPALFVEVLELPLTPNGKVDRQALPMPDEISSPPASVPARTETERMLVEIWQQVLGMKQVGIYDTFFELGGHSLLATRLISRLRETFHRDLSLRLVFELPTIASQAEHLDTLMRNNTEVTLELPLQRVSRDEPLPLSFAQQRLWFLHHLEAGNVFYNEFGALRLQGKLDREALERSLSEIIARHEILRTLFVVNADGQPVQKILPPKRLLLTSVDLRSWPLQEREAEVRRLGKAEARYPLILDQGPLFRAQLVQIGDEQSILFLVMHHIISDGWSVGILLRELGTLYTAFCNGESSPLAELSLQYADYAYWQRNWLTGDVLEQQLSYWKEKLQGMPMVLELPTDFTRPSVQTFEGARYIKVIEAELVSQLKELSLQEDVTLFMTLLAVFQLLLHKYTGSKDFVVGIPVAGRTRAETEALIGFFVNTLVLRMDLRGNPDMHTLLKRVRSVTLEAYAQQDLSFERLVEELQPERDLSHNPLIQVMFALQNAPTEHLDMPGLTVSPVQICSDTTKFDLTLLLEEVGGELVMAWEYNTSLFAPATIQRMASHYYNLLSTIVHTPEKRLGEISPMSEQERRQVLYGWNQTQREIPELALAQIFEEQVRQRPQAWALVQAEERMSYEQLNIRANQLGWWLRKQGVGPEVCVGVHFAHSCALLVAVLAIIKAGGAYVPLDPEYPRERLQFMLTDAQVELVLMDQPYEEALVGYMGRQIHMDGVQQAVSQQPTENLPTRASQQNLAYIIYTSGSTGQPKGVQICQRSIVRLLFGVQYVQLDEQQTLLHSAPISFDAATFEVWGALLHGGTCVLPSQRLLTAQELGAQIERYAVTTMWLTASLYNALVEQDAHALAGVRQLLIGGEALSVRHVRSGQQRLNQTQIINGYGPTESTTFTCCYPIPSPVPSEWQTIPLGGPIGNTQVYVLNEQYEPVALGVPGDLYIGGEGLARGYVGRPDLTAERFVPGIVGSGERWYQTGDVVRWRDDGTLEYLGRKDEQVKIRGYRIELAEVEEWLRRYAGVREAVARMWEEANGSKRLVGYVVMEAGAELKEREVVAWMRERVPEYMLPWVVMAIEQVPLTTNGKVDRGRLPGIKREQVIGEQETGRTVEEMLLVEIWKQVLRLETIGVRENFFEQGGDSILSIQIAAQARQRGWELTARQVFQHQTIAELAQVLRPVGGEQEEQEEIEEWVELTPIQHWFMELEVPRRSHWNQALLVQVPQEVEATAVAQAIEAVVQQHGALRYSFARREEGWRQRVNQHVAGGKLERVDLSELKGQEQEQTMEGKANEWQRSLDLEAGVMMRAVLFELGAGGRRLLLIVHHLVIDGVSWRIMLEDLRQAYEQVKQDQPVQLLRERTSYRQWAKRLWEYGQSNAIKGQDDYWLKQAEPGAHLPVDGPGEENDTRMVQILSASLSIVETQQLLSQVPGAYRMQVNEVLMTALVQTLTEWMGEEVVRITLEGHGREEVDEGIDLSRTVGWFTALYPLRLEMKRGASADEALKGIKEQLRKVPDKGVGYGVLRYLRRDKRIREVFAQHGEPEISFNYLGQFDQLFEADRAWKPAKGPIGLVHDPLSQRTHMLDVVASVVDNRLHVQWHYSQAFHQKATIERLAHSYIEALQHFIAHCLSPESAGYTPVDFPLARLDQASLDHVQSNIRRIEDIYPLAPLQHGLLFHNLYEPTSGAYFVQLHCVLQGDLDISAFERAWQTITQCHAILRTAFLWENVSIPVQVVSAQVEISLTQHDWRAYTDDQLAEKLQDFLATDRQHSFDVSMAPLMRLTLCQVNADTYHFIWSHHHLLLDGWSLPIIFKELFALYQAYTRQEQIQLPPCRPYRDYIAWLQLQDYTDAERFWRQMLQGFSEPTRLCSEKAHTTTALFMEYKLTLSHELTRQLQLFSRQQQITLNTLLQGLWALLLSFYSGQQDIVFGATVSGRPPAVAGIESMVGLFINSLPVRIRIVPTLSCQAWFQQIQEQQAEQRLYEYTPLVRVQSWSDLPQETALFESLFVFENYPVDVTARESGMSFEITQINSLERTNYPLALGIIPGAELAIKALYDCNRFETQDIQRLLNHFPPLLENLLAMPAQSLANLSPLSAADYEQIVGTWNQTWTAYPREACIADLFERQVTATPKAVAIVCGNEKMSYADLNGRANQLAHYLRGAGAGPEKLVGLCMERSINQLVVILGIVKAQAAYLPLDPTYPEERLAMMLENAAVTLIITEEAQRERLSPHAHCLYLEQLFALLEDQSQENLQREVYADNLLYVMYTSGSTGRPKGVCITQRAVVRLVCNTDYVQLTAEDRVVQAANIAFDASTFELWGAWLHGACLVMLMKDELLSLSRFAQVLYEQRVNTLVLTTALFNQMARETPQVFRSLKHLIFGGEAVDVHRVQQVLEQGAPQRLVHAYGPTESTTIASWYLIEQREAAREAIPIGRPIANTQLYVLNALQQPVPVGAAGELYIGGDGLARGYLNLPALTAEKFVPHPWSLEAGARLYRTGDVVKQLADGAIVFVGRVDHQVKIRGHRIELEEIMQVLEQHPEVQGSLVVVREDTEKKQLVAYVIAKEESQLKSGDLRTYLLKRLPDYMVPVHYVRMAAFPLTHNGKIDRRALPLPDDTSLVREQELTTSHTPLESQLTHIWSQILHVEQVGIHDNFFTLGGDSILSIQISARAKQAGIALTPKLLFQHQTIAELGTAIEQEQPQQKQMQPSVGAAPLTPIQRWFFEQALSDRHHWNQALLLSLPDTLDRETLSTALHYLAQFHEALSLRFEEQDGQWRQVRREEPGEEILAYFDLRGQEAERQDDEMAKLATELQSSLNITQGWLVRAGLFELGSRGRRLLLIIHHLVVDGVSWRILLEDLLSICEQLSHNTAVQLLPESTSYHQWATQLSRYVQTEAFKAEGEYWLSQVQPQDETFPLDSPDGENTLASLATVTAYLSHDDSQALLLEVPGAYHIQVQEVLLTALVQTLTEWMHSQALRIDLEGHGREDLLPDCDLSRTVGWFTCMYPLLLDVREAHTPGALLKTVKEQLSAVPQKGLSYGFLRYLKADNAVGIQLANVPDPAVSFNYLGQFDQIFDRRTGWMPATETTGLVADTAGQRAHLLDVAISILGGQLQLQLAYSSQLHMQATIEQLAHDYLATLGKLIKYCLEPESNQLIAAGFPRAKVSQKQLDKISAKMKKKSER